MGRVFRNPSNNTNGNMFDYQGRQISFEHGPGAWGVTNSTASITVLADKCKGKRLNSPNDGAAHPDGWYLVHRPGYGAHSMKATKASGSTTGSVSPSVSAIQKRGGPPGHRWDPAAGSMTVIVDDNVSNPNGLCFSPDFKKVYVAEHRAFALPTGKGDIQVYDVGSDNKNVKPEGVHRLQGRWRALAVPDGIRADVFGNLWCASNAGGRVTATAGCTCLEPGGQAARPDPAARDMRQPVTFGGPKRNRLFMAGKPVALRRFMTRLKARLTADARIDPRIPANENSPRTFRCAGFSLVGRASGPDWYRLGIRTAGYNPR